MNSSKIYLLLCLSAGLFLFSACNKDDDETMANTITITIEEPLNDSTPSDCSDVHVHIKIEASVENHEVEIVLHPEGDTADKIIDFDKHSHDQTISFDQEVDLCSYGAGSCFHLEVEACLDHDCETRETTDVEFCLQ